ncbi:queuosine precursor transporter [uncultured Treponema sp.]|uniref:queuosine precursor transporter n=1 Tax=uncultured Treponema sp. TaxID=162155 RepID=UPI0025EBA7B6|nr:queuosine precursor transporter [uncultured Treponema sp.]
MNEILMLASVPVFFGGLVLFFRLFGKHGIFAWTVICTITANIEVLILVHAFGMDTTLGNVLFASSFLATDIMSELYGKKEANKCVKLGIAANITFILISQSWFLYIPAEADTMATPIKTVFANTPRVMLASLFAYVVCELYDVWAYHHVWAWTEKKFGDRKRFLWLRNNGSTLVSQLINVVVFNLLAFAGVFPADIIIQILIFGYAIFIVTSILDTPFLYLARRIAEKHPELLSND